MVKDKGIIYLSQKKDLDILPIFNDLKKAQIVPYKYKNKTKEWMQISVKIGRKCKKLMDYDEPNNGLMFPPSTNRNQKIGFIQRPRDIELEIKPLKDNYKIIFNRKIF